MERRTLVLWDIDHTLMETGGVGALVYQAAFEVVTGVRMRAHADVTGGTEPALFRANLQLNGLSEQDADELFASFATQQASEYAQRIDELRGRGRALPGAQETLQTLAARDDVVQTVLTGNTRASGQIKLEAFGLDGYLDLNSGAYGTDADERADLITIARERSGWSRGTEFAASSTVLLADTLADMKAGRSSGIRTIGVATGKSTADELLAAGAHVELPGLANLEDVLAAIFGKVVE